MGCKGLPGTNTLAYYLIGSISKFRSAVNYSRLESLTKDTHSSLLSYWPICKFQSAVNYSRLGRLAGTNTLAYYLIGPICKFRSAVNYTWLESLTKDIHSSLLSYWPNL